MEFERGGKRRKLKTNAAKSKVMRCCLRDGMAGRIDVSI